MTTFIVTVIYVLIWRLSVLACGLISIFLGYRLFMSGLTAHEDSL
jgi:hypothetical protein